MHIVYPVCIAAVAGVISGAAAYWCADWPLACAAGALGFAAALYAIATRTGV